ncbi:MAG: hypothetical protein ACK6D3_04725 [Planctomycetaceae bacterium]|jgi:hypothetical protein
MAKAAYTKDDLIAQIIKLRLVENWSTKSILDFLQDDLGYGQTQSYEYIKWAKEEIKERYKRTNDAAVEEAIYQYEEMLEKAKSKGDIKLWNELKKELNKITGIYSTQKIELSGEINGININIIKKDELGD